MRTAFINQLIEERRKNDRVFLIVGDLGYHVVDDFANEFPESFLNAGIAEQNMMGVAAGLAHEGFIVYVYSIGNFPTMRCLEQIRNDIAYNNLNVRIISVGAGFAYGSLGASHHTTEDIAIMRSLPNMVVASPSDPIETKIITSLSVIHQGPMYLRLGKAGEKFTHQPEEFTELKIGSIVPIIYKPDSIAIFSTGSITSAIQTEIRNKKLPYSLYSVPFIKPLDKKSVLSICKKHDKFITLEEHQSSGGMSSAIVEIINDLYESGKIEKYPHIKRKAIPDKFIYTVGNQNDLREHVNISLD